MFWFVAKIVSVNWASPARAFIRSLSIAIAFAPTGIVAGWVGFPAPASLVLIGHLFEKEPYDVGYLKNLRFAAVCFGAFWFATLIVCLLIEASKDAKKAQLRGENEVTRPEP